jgi:hypothetical protein
VHNTWKKLFVLPSSMIPTLYGLGLTKHVDLECEIFMRNEKLGRLLARTLTWSPARQFKNVPFCLSPAIEIILKKLLKKCYIIEDYDCRQELNEKICFKTYTPLTFSNMASLLTRHDRKHGDLPQWTFMEVAPRF